jgi:hypothetical protein
MEQTSLIQDAAANLGGHLRGKPRIMWRNPDPTQAVARAAGMDPAGLPSHLAKLRSRHRRASVFEFMGLAANIGACLSLAALAWDGGGPFGQVPSAVLSAVTGLLALHFMVTGRARVMATRARYGGGDPHPWEANPQAIAVSDVRVWAAGRRGKPRSILLEHLEALQVDRIGDDGHAVRFLARGKDGPSLFAKASRVDEASARALVAALHGRITGFEGHAAAMSQEIAARTVVLAPAAYDAAKAAVDGGRYGSLDDLASAAVTKALAA